MAEPMLGRDEYAKHFNTEAYVGMYNAEMLQSRQDIRNIYTALWKVLQVVPSGRHLNILDFGSGPSIAASICASAKAGNIVCADFLEANIAEINKWIQRDPNAHDWTPYFEFVGSFEGKRAEEIDSQVRSVIKEAIPCDALAEHPIGQNKYAPFDIIISSLCLQAACLDHDTFNVTVKKLCDILKPGGFLVLTGMFDETYYFMDHISNKFASLNQSKGDIENAFKYANLESPIWHMFSYPCVSPEENYSDATSYYVVAAQKINVDKND